MRIRALMRGAFLCGLLTFTMARAATRYPCESPPAVQAELQRLGRLPEPGRASEAERSKRAMALGVLRQRYPRDTAIHRAYQIAVVNAAPVPAEARRALDEEYRRLLEAHPGDPLYLYLHGALLLMDLSTKDEGVRQLQAALLAAPGFPAAHRELIGFYRLEWNEDQERLRHHLESLTGLCPESLDTYIYVDALDDINLKKKAAGKVRALLSGRKNPGSLVGYRSLWGMEFDNRPVSEYDAVRASIRRDLGRLRRIHREVARSWQDTLRESRESPADTGARPRLPPQSYRDWLEMLQAGYDYLGDEEGIAWVEDQLVEAFPESYRALEILSERFEKQHPRADREQGDEEARRLHYAALLGAAREWSRRWPGALWAWDDRLEAILHLDRVPPGEIEEVAAGTNRAIAGDRGEIFYSRQPRLKIAEAYLKNGIRLEEIPVLVEQALRDQDLLDRKRLRSAPEVKAISWSVDSHHLESYTEARSLLVDAYMKMGRLEAAASVLTEMSALIEKSRDPDAAPEHQRWHAGQEGAYWSSRARFLEAHGRSADALAAFQAAALLIERSSREPRNDVEAGAAKEAHRLFTALGGTVEGWQAWRRSLESAAAPSAREVEDTWETIGKALPDFRLEDVRGRTWTLADLKGKTTLINVWNMSCLACRAELPLLQALHERIKDRMDMRILTMNLDDSVALLQPFVKKEGLTIPVIPASDFVASVMTHTAIPRNWIIDRSGTLTEEFVGFRGDDPEAWIEELLKRLEEAGKP